MIEVIHEHSVDMDLLPKKATILDLGCRGMEFTNHFLGLKHKVFPLDIDDLPGDYERCAIAGFTGYCGILRGSDPQGTKIGPINHFTGEQIPCYTLEDYMRIKGVKFWDLIKLDVEGTEEEIIMGLTKAPSKQLSIEFHMHCGQTGSQVNNVVLKLNSLGYCIEQHIYETRHGAGFNYWDSLFLLK